MRDPKRIRPILDTIERIWKREPDLRLTQLIMNALEMADDPYYVEDDILINALRRYNINM